MRTGRARTFRRVLVAAVGATALAISGCGNSSQSGADDAIAKGSTLTIGVSTPQTGPLAINHEVAQGLQAYFKSRNATGGVAGHKVEVDFVDNQGTVAGGATALRSIVASDPFAVSIVSTAAFTGAQSALKASAGTPVLVVANGSAIKAADLPNTLGMFTDYTTESFAGIEHLVSLGKKKLALVYDPTIGEQAAVQDSGFAKKVGAELVSKIAVPATTTNYTPVVQKLRDSGADGIVYQIAAPGLAGTAKAAAQAGLRLPSVTYSGLLDSSVLKLGGSSLDGLYFTALFPLLSDTSAPVKEFSRQIKKYAPHAETVLGLIGWNAGILAETAIKDATAKGDLTRASFMAAMRALGGRPIGVLDDLGWSAKDAHSIDAGKTDVFSLYRAKDGEFVKVDS
jgi:branched-chain amino acid transport system substrate-binding protein